MLHLETVIHQCTVNSPFSVRPFFADYSTNSQQISSKCISWILKLYLSSLHACRYVGLPCEKFAHTLHDICAPFVVMISVLTLDAITLVYYDVTGVTFIEHYDVTMFNKGHACDVIIH